MSSDSEDENYCFYGKALEPYDEDAFPKKRPISVEDQIATDAQGRRRFHGAFTGGFSAGFFNTVGSIEGWTPSEFKSSRADKAEKKVRKPEDYMDDEDIGEFGIAPQVVRAKEEFATKKKRKKKTFSDGPIPGEPVLETLLSSGNETVGYLLLRNMGLKHRNDDKENETEVTGAKIYGCEMPKVQETSKPYEVAQYSIPEIYKEFLNKPKSNNFGLGYIGLDKTHINLFQTTNLVVQGKNNKKMTISGQAFGVGAFEEEDEDIYTKDNMSKYDFELTSEAATTKSVVNDERDTVFGLFKLAKQKLSLGEFFAPPPIPHSFSGKHNVRKSRFEPLPEEKPATVERKHIDAKIRAQYLGEDTNKSLTPSGEQHKKANEISSKMPTPASSAKENEEEKDESSSIGGFNLLLDRFVSASQADSQNILEPVKRSENLHGTKEMRDAAAMKMFGPLTRITFDWKPCSLLCKRFNVPEPNCGDDSQKSRKRTKHLIFEYQKETDADSMHQPGLSIQKKEVEEPKTEAHFSGGNSSVSQTEMIQEPSTSYANNLTRSEVTETLEASNIEISEGATRTIDLTEKVDVAKNTDLFKAIFLDSSESESEDEKEEHENRTRSETLKATVLNDSLLPKIKTKKDGILSNVDFSQFSTATLPTANAATATANTSNTSLEVPDNAGVSLDAGKTNGSADDLSYGPKPPQTLVNTNRITSSFPVEENIDEWIEKDREEGSSHKHKKKNKKEKHEHKRKHKHKHDKKRK